MKRVICIAWVLVLLLVSCSTQEPESAMPEAHYTQGIYRLTFKARQISNDGVGNDWSLTYTYNGETIKSGYQITQSLGVFSFQTIEVEIREDDKIDDVGNGTLHVAICDGGSGKTEITVIEQSGKNNGNTAVWEVTCEVELVGKQ